MIPFRTAAHGAVFVFSFTAASLAGACNVPSLGPGGIHARMSYSEEWGLQVVDAPPSGPAARAGIREGDRIISIDDELVDAMTMSEVVERLRGPAGTTVHLVVARDGERLSFDVLRAPYERRGH